ncbi:uncharacterized protein LOC116840614 [Odontomachus brunneus]|uniref:uncharacterized protein LOC116840614 n=1 Tax=Odontomachus brunneus TaxID=486640 RepID=UPI0013F1F214|nr:uncharacterized protein LOC116840614 [Odontomachus brunneus]
MSNKNIYNLSEEQQQIARWRDVKRKQLREIYLRDSGHPTKSLLCDTGIYRFASANATVAKRFVPTLTSFLTKVFIIGGLITATYLKLEKDKREQEHKLRTGQVSYADRNCKFV